MELCPLYSVCYPKHFVRQLAALVVKQTCVTEQETETQREICS